MKRTGKVITYLVVLAMVTSLFAGLGFADKKVSANVNKTFTVLEIVPNESMRQFGYLISGQEPINIKAVNTARVAAGDSSFRTYINNSGIGTINAGGDYVSNDVFRTEVLPSKTPSNENIDWTVNYKYKTFAQLSDSDITSADLIVITDSVPAQLQQDGVTVTSFNSLGNDVVTWSKVYKVFKKIAGIDGVTPVPYVIDNNLYSNVSKSNLSDRYFYYTPNYQDIGNRDENFQIPYLEGDNTKGSSKNIFKLFLMLTSMKPSNFYGIYVKDRGSYYGVDEHTGKLYGFACLADTKGNLYNAKGYDHWGVNLIKPYFISKVENGNANVNDAITKIGYRNSSSLLGSDSYKVFSKEGLVYKDGLVSNYNGYETQFATLVSDVYFGGRNIVDGRNYRFLIVTPADLDANVNKSITADIVNYVRTNGDKGLAGGIKVDCMSMIQFTSLSTPIEETYDCIYFGGDGSKYLSAASSTTSLDSKYQTFGGMGTTVLAGNDLTHAKYTELTNFVDTKKLPVVISKQLKDSSVDTSTYMYDFLDGLTYNNGSNGSNVFEDTSNAGTGVSFASIFTAIKNKKDFSLSLLKTPAVYFANVNLQFNSQNGNYSYFANNVSDPNYTAYINSKDKEDYRKLDFKFRIDGNTGKSFTAKLYLDMNSDGKYNEAAGHYELENGVYVLKGGEMFWSHAGYNENTDYTIAPDPLPPGYVGSVNWKLSVTDGTYTYSTLGYSACRSTSDDAVHDIKVLQVYPTFTNDANSGGVWKDGMNNSGNGWGQFQLSMPSLILPNDTEIANAKAEHGNITDIAINSNLDAIDTYFSGYLYASQANCQDHFNKTDGAGAEFKTTPTSQALNANTNNLSKIMIRNAGSYYYFIEKQKDYNVHATKFSVYEFNQKVAQNKIFYEEATKKIVYKETTTSTPVYFDLLMLGFGSTMDYMTPAAIKVITDYVDADQPTFCGSGTVTFSCRNTLGVALRDRIGQDRYNVTQNNGSSTSGLYGLPYQKNSTTVYGANSKYYLQGLTWGYAGAPDGNGGENSVNGMRINENVLTNYPYKIPEKFKVTSGPIQPFQLDLEDEDIVVSIAKFDRGLYYKTTKWGDARDNYYLYKKGNITFCGFGKTAANYDRDQVGSVMTHPEACLLINALVAASETRTNGGNDNAYVTCTDPDSSSVDIVGVDPFDPTKQVHTYKDYVYVDYDATQDNMTGTTAPMGNSSIVNAAPNGTSYGYTARRVPYEATVSTTADLKICKTGTDTKIDIKVYKVNDDDTLTEAPKNASGNYIITNGDTYMIDVPLNDSFYTDKGISGCGLTGRDSFNVDIVVTTDNDPEKVEKNELNVVRRGMFLIN
ncbi:MAG: DUF5057 domain-containing protein [Lachnospiraceae bacterium]|nr:DUF5057 domain-containing protein [Lachnospiraceae bacterium]